MKLKNLFLNKKGNIEVQFSWIFVLAIGVLIILFFISVVKTSSKNSTQETYFDLNTNLKNIIYQTQSDSNNMRTIKMPQVTIEFDCDTFQLTESASSQNIKYITLFAPSKIKGRLLLTNTIQYKMPYPADSFLYLTSNEIRYTFIRKPSCVPCDNLITKMIKNLPLNSSYQIIDALNMELTDNNNFREKIIIVGSESDVSSLTLHSTISAMKTENVNLLLIKSLNSEHGEVKFYKKSGPGFTPVSSNSPNYLGFPMLMGAVVTDSEELYFCNARKGILKLGIQNYIYLNRTNDFRKAYAPYTPNAPNEYYCQQLYNGISIPLINESDINNTIKINNFFNDINTLQQANNESILNSCPLIY